MEHNLKNAVEIFSDFTEIEKPKDLFLHRLLIEEAGKRLREIKENLDAELIARMKKNNQQSFEIELQNGKNKVFYSKKKTETIKSPLTLINMLFSNNQAHNTMARNALSEGQGAWKKAEVRLMQDTLGIELLETSYEDKIEVKVLPVDVLKNKGVKI